MGIRKKIKTELNPVEEINNLKRSVSNVDVYSANNQTK